MAFKEVTVEHGEGAGGEFVRFNAIGDKVQGIYAGSSESRSQYAKQGDKVFRFLCKEGPKFVMKLVEAPVNVQSKLRKAESEGLLKPGRVAMLTYKSDVDTGKESKMKFIEVKIDDEDKPAALEALKKHGAAAAAAAKPKPKAEDDLFGDGSGGDDIPF